MGFAVKLNRLESKNIMVIMSFLPAEEIEMHMHFANIQRNKETNWGIKGNCVIILHGLVIAHNLGIFSNIHFIRSLRIILVLILALPFYHILNWLQIS